MVHEVLLGVGFRAQGAWPRVSSRGFWGDASGDSPKKEDLARDGEKGGRWSRVLRGLGFRVPGSGSRVQGSRFQVSGSEFRFPGSGFRDSGSGFWFLESGSDFRVPGFKFQVSGFRFRG